MTKRRYWEAYSETLRIKESEWDRYYNVAKQYYNVKKHLNIPPYYIYGGVDLGWWVWKQRDELTPSNRRLLKNKDRVAKLDAIGMVWSVKEADWYFFYDVALSYFLEHGTLDAPDGCVIPAYCGRYNLALGKWLVKQRRARRDKLKYLTKEKIQLLDDIGMKW